MTIINTGIRNFQQKSKNLRTYLDYRVNKIVFLVRNAINSSSNAFFFTQHLLPDVKPYYVYFRGMDMTRFITGKQHLTLFSYEVLSILASEYGWTFRDIRSYFNINFKSKRLKNLSLSSRKLQHTIPIAAKRIAFQSAGTESLNVSDNNIVPRDSNNRKRKSDKELIAEAKRSMHSVPSTVQEQLPTSSSKKRERSVSPSDVPLSQRLCIAQVACSQPIEADNSQSVDKQTRIIQPGASAIGGEFDLRTARLFSKFTNFSAALKLVALNIMPNLRFPQTRFEMYYGLMSEGFDSDVLERFRSYLAVRFPPLVTAEGLHQVVNEYVRFGGLSIQDRIVYYDQDLELVKKKKSDWFSKILY